MLVQREYAMPDPRDVRRLIAAHGWATLVAHGSRGLAASHVPCLLDPERDPGGDAAELVLLSHTARADPLSRALLGGRDVLLVFQGPHGYVSAAWYEAGPYVPTWNFVVVHVHGRPEVLEDEAGFAVLERTVEHFEAAREPPWSLDASLDYARRIAPGTVAFRLRATRIEAKAKLSQDKPPQERERVIAALERDGPDRNDALADEMRRSGGGDTAR